MSGPVGVPSSGSATFYATYTLTADALVYYDIGIDGLTSGSAPASAWIEVTILPEGGAQFNLAASPLGPNRRHGSVYLPKGSKITGDYANSDSITHYVSGFVSVFYPANI